MADQPDKPVDPTDLLLPSSSNAPMEMQYATASTSAMPFAEPTITAPKSKAQKQREYRQRIAASRTPEQAAAMKKSNTERQRNYRLCKAANSAIASGSLESTTASTSRSGKMSNNVQTGTQRLCYVFPGLDHQDIKQENITSDHNITNDLLLKPTTREDYVMENIEAESDDVSMIQTKDTTDCNFDCRLATKKVDTRWGTAADYDMGSCMTVHKSHLHDVRVYTAKKLYSCNICNKTFRMKNNLTLHMSLHSTKQCLGEVCNESFKIKSSVSNFMSTISSKNKFSWHDSNKPFNDKANGTEHLNTHTATKSYSCDKVFRHNSNLTEKTASVRPLPRDVTIDGIKLEYDDYSHKQVKTNQEHLTNNDIFGGSITTEDFVIDDIKFENDDTVTLGRISTEDKIDYDLESETITTEELVTDNIKVKIKQEIITAEDFTNIDMLCRSSLPTDVGFNNVKVKTCMGMKKDGVNESATNAHVKHEDIFMGEDYSSDDNIPLAEEKAKLSAAAEQHVTKIPNDSSQVKVDTRRWPAADGGLTVDKLSCDICPYQTNSEPQLLSHLKAHAAVHKNRLQDQINLHSSKKIYSCDVCSKNFCYKSKLTVHLTTHFRGRRFSCKVCHKKFSKRIYLTRHIMRTHSGEKPFSCEVCHKTFSIRSDLSRHMRTHSREKPFSCTVCNKTYYTKNYLVCHMMIHSGEKPFLCEVCHKTFSIKSYLSRHMRTHSREKLFSCKVCHKTYSTISYLACHMRTHSGEKPYSCEVCHKTFSMRNNLKRHKRTHSSGKPFSCEVCYKKYSDRSYLAYHMKTHSGEKPFSCEVCHKTYSTRYYRTEHMKTHLEEKHIPDEKLFSCEVCHKTFSIRSDLSRHMKTHSREKPFSCTVCNKTYYTKNYLACHMMIHSGKKPFSCEVCHKTFRMKSNLSRHMRTHPGELPFSCKVCHKTFSFEYNLAYHMRTHSRRKTVFV